jgi:hypothetical protein
METVSTATSSTQRLTMMGRTLTTTLKLTLTVWMRTGYFIPVEVWERMKSFCHVLWTERRLHMKGLFFVVVFLTLPFTGFSFGSALRHFAEKNLNVQKNHVQICPMT